MTTHPPPEEEAALELRVILREETRVPRDHPGGRHGAAYLAILDALRDHGVWGATVLRGMAGYGADGRPYRSTFLESGAHHGPPLVIIAIDRPDKIRGVLAEVSALAPEALLVTGHVRVHHGAN